jgi:hypothetical protein
MQQMQRGESDIGQKIKMLVRLLRRHTLYYPRLLTLTLQVGPSRAPAREKRPETGSQVR